MKELIYSNKFPNDDAPKIQPGHFLNIFSYKAYDVYDELVFVPIPGREEIEKIFYFKAIELSNKYKYDIKVYSGKGAIEVCLSFDYLYSYSDLPHLIGMADSIAFYTGIFNRYSTISLILYTHDIYYNGKRVLPDPEDGAKNPEP